MKWNMCGQTFNIFVDLEIHIKSHEQHQMFQCDQCEKHFALLWRLQKHMKLHTEKVRKYCHYFNNSDKCPHEEYGCTFLHSVSKICKYSQTGVGKLFPYRHSEGKRTSINETMIDTVDENDIEENYMTTEEKSFTASTPRKRKF